MYNKPYARQENVIRINRLLHKLDTKSINTSTWRLEFGWKPLCKLFLNRVTGQTPKIEPLNRYHESVEYLNQNNHQEISLLAIDDNPNYFRSATNVHITNGEVGMTASEVGALKSIRRITATSLYIKAENLRLDMPERSVYPASI
ncbi:MAG: HAD domain-containing protein [Candidatus Thiodiazotropha lotti]|nr:HAD domain-containing protein [Candidatus Thiodiazotropha lotti]